LNNFFNFVNKKKLKKKERDEIFENLDFILKRSISQPGDAVGAISA